MNPTYLECNKTKNDVICSIYGIVSPVYSFFFFFEKSSNHSSCQKPSHIQYTLYNKGVYSIIYVDSITDFG